MDGIQDRTTSGKRNRKAKDPLGMDLLAGLSLRRLRSFLAVCDTMHVARAAEKLGVAQPALSQQIRALEEALGVQLFHRRKRGIDLTAAGRACRTEAERLLALHAGAVDFIRRTARGEAGRVALGYVGSAVFEERFTAQLRRMRERFPEVELGLSEASIGGLLAALDRGELDAAVVRAPVEVERPLRHLVQVRQRVVAIFPAGHPLAAAASVSIRDLAREPLVGYSDPVDVGLMRVASDMAADAGVTLTVGWQVREVGSVLGLVAAGLGYGLVAEGLAARAPGGIVSRPIAESSATTELWLIWHEDRVTPALQRFLEIAGATKLRPPRAAAGDAPAA